MTSLPYPQGGPRFKHTKPLFLPPLHVPEQLCLDEDPAGMHASSVTAVDNPADPLSGSWSPNNVDTEIRGYENGDAVGLTSIIHFPSGHTIHQMHSQMSTESTTTLHSTDSVVVWAPYHSPELATPDSRGNLGVVEDGAKKPPLYVMSPMMRNTLGYDKQWKPPDFLGKLSEDITTAEAHLTESVTRDRMATHVQFAPHRSSPTFATPVPTQSLPTERHRMASDDANEASLPCDTRRQDVEKPHKRPRRHHRNKSERQTFDTIILSGTGSSGEVCPLSSFGPRGRFAAINHATIEPLVKTNGHVPVCAHPLLPGVTDQLSPHSTPSGSDLRVKTRPPRALPPQREAEKNV